MKRTSLRSSRLLFALSAVSLLLAVVPLCFAGIADDVHAAVVQNRLDSAEGALNSYRAEHGETPEYLDALSWLARGYLNGNQLDRAQNYAKRIEAQARQQLLKRQLDTEPHLPNALGAAIEVEAQVFLSRGQRAQAIALLRRNLARYRATSIRARLQKNLNLLGLSGQPAPPLNIAQYLGPKPNDLSALKGSPVLLFFWAHWCADCKSEGPIITQLRTEFGPKGPGLGGIPVPISAANFNNYGCSTTPTLVLLDRSGRVALYHPGVLPYETLRAAVEKTVAN